jgi:hypothetical protein
VTERARRYLEVCGLPSEQASAAQLETVDLLMSVPARLTIEDLRYALTGTDPYSQGDRP